jgi:peptidylprolyl isomerase
LLKIFLVKGLILTGAVCGALALVGCGGGDSPAAESPQPPSSQVGEEATGRSEPKIRLPKNLTPESKKLIVKDLVEGSGRQVEIGDELEVEYLGVRGNGEPYGSSWERSEPYSFKFGSGRLSHAWEKGLRGMRVGGRREVIVPAYVLHGNTIPNKIYRKDSLVYVVDLIDAR